MLKLIHCGYLWCTGYATAGTSGMFEKHSRGYQAVHWARFELYFCGYHVVHYHMIELDFTMQYIGDN